MMEDDDCAIEEENNAKQTENKSPKAKQGRVSSAQKPTQNCLQSLNRVDSTYMSHTR